MRVIIFDLFDTILDKVWFDYDKILDFLVSDCFVGVDKKELIEYANKYREKYMINRNETNIEVSFIDQVRYYESRLNQTALFECDDLEWKAFMRSRKEVLSDRCVEVLSYFKELGYKLAILSNGIFSHKTIEKYLDGFGIREYFDVVVSSADIKVRKPAKAAFEYVLGQLGINANAEVYFVGNNLQKDVLGGRNAGITPIFINKNNESFDGVSVKSLYGVKQYFENNFIYVNGIAPKESLVDGPGLRTVVFLQGCNKHCSECHNPQTWSLSGGERLLVTDLANRIKRTSKNKKITITGGEPLLQQSALIMLFELLTDYDICLYTGYDFNDVPKEIKDAVNYLKVGGFEKEKRTTTTPFVGSTNQRLIDMRKKK